MNGKQNVLSIVISDLWQPKTDVLKSVLFFLSPAQKTLTYMYENSVMDGHMDSFGTQQQQQEQHRSSSCSGISCCGPRDCEAQLRPFQAVVLPL